MTTPEIRQAIVQSIGVIRDLCDDGPEAFGWKYDHYTDEQLLLVLGRLQAIEAAMRWAFVREGE